jgi:hypothetical protein
MIRRRGNSFQAILFAGTDPVTGRQLYLRGSSTDEAETKKKSEGSVGTRSTPAGPAPDKDNAQDELP